MLNFKRVLILNRGEIAARIASTLRKMKLEPIVVYSEADKHTLAVNEAGESYCLGPAPLAESYLNAEKVLKLAKEIKAEAVHPGYGLFSENSQFARQVEAAGLVWIGPRPTSMEQIASKSKAKALAAQLGVPILESFTGPQDVATFKKEAQRIGFPILLKASAGGGGRGIRKVENLEQLTEQFELARSEAVKAFKDGELLIEKYLDEAHHVEVQIFGDSKGEVVHLGDRDCSAQRRNQKIVEESPSPAITDSQRQALFQDALKIAKACHYTNAGTIEFLVSSSGQHYFLEMNTRLQVEHPVTEQVTGIDLVEWQVRIAMGERLPLRQSDIKLQGHSIEARVYAEDPSENYRPQTGRLEGFVFPADARVDHFLTPQTNISSYYDSMIAKLIVYGENRNAALAKLDQALSQTLIGGVKTNISYLRDILQSEFFQSGRTLTKNLERLPFRKAEEDVPQGALALAAALLTARFDGEKSRSVGELRGWSNSSAHYGLRILEYNNIRYKCRVEFKADCLEIEVAEGTFQFNKKELTAIPHLIYGGKIEIQFNGQAYIFVDPSLRLSRRLDDLNENVIVAPMEGTITQVGVSEGQNAEAGQILIVIEAMKMQFELRSPRAAVVQSIPVRLGSQVKAKQALVHLQPQT